MNLRNAIFITATAVLLALQGETATAAPVLVPAGAPALLQLLPKSLFKSMKGVSRGIISSIDSQRLILSHKKRGGETEELTFVLNSDTERKGDLKPGSRVSVHYRVENDVLLATAVQSMRQKTESNETDRYN